MTYFDNIENANSRNNKRKGDINEIYLGLFLVDGDWKRFDKSEDVKSCISSLNEKISNDELETQIGRAKEMAKVVKEKLKIESDKIKKVYWTAKAGELSRVTNGKATYKGNPTDILVEFNDDTFIGLSAKSSSRKEELTIKNPGIGTLDNILGTKMTELVVDTEDSAQKNFSLPLLKKDRKPFIREHKELREKTQNIGSNLIVQVRDMLYSRLMKLSDSESKEHLKNHWFNANNSSLTYYKVTGRGKDGNFSATIHDPNNNIWLKNIDTGDIMYKKLSNYAIGVFAGEQRVLKMRFKYESEKLASSLKLSGEPWK